LLSHLCQSWSANIYLALSSVEEEHKLSSPMPATLCSMLVPRSPSLGTYVWPPWAHHFARRRRQKMTAKNSALAARPDQVALPQHIGITRIVRHVAYNVFKKGLFTVHNTFRWKWSITNFLL
jgi:hypothetical protein